MKWFVTHFSFPLGLGFVSLVLVLCSISLSERWKTAMDCAAWAVGLAAVAALILALTGVALLGKHRAPPANREAQSRDMNQ